MPRIIFKCPHIKGGTQKASSHLNNYVSYVATRDGVECIKPEKNGLPATQKQKDFIEQLVREFPLSKALFEYADYSAAPTGGHLSHGRWRIIWTRLPKKKTIWNILPSVLMYRKWVHTVCFL